MGFAQILDEMRHTRTREGRIFMITRIDRMVCFVLWLLDKFCGKLAIAEHDLNTGHGILDGHFWSWGCW